MSTDSTVSSTNISAKFQYAARLADIPALSTETKKPTFTSIYHFLVDKLLANASSIPYPGTDLGHISLVLTDQEEFLTINNKNIASNPPADPGPTIVTPQGATASQIQQLHRDYVLSTRYSTASTPPHTHIFKLDSGATSRHFYDTYKTTLLCKPISTKNPAINVLILNSADIMQSTSTASLPIPSFPATATKAHDGFPHLASGSLLSVSQICDHHHCTAIFISTKANIYKNKDIDIKVKGQSILEGTHSAHDPPTHCTPQFTIKQTLLQIILLSSQIA